MFYLTRKEHFNAAHKIQNPDWTDEKNLEVFGKCANPNWHGHNYVLYVTVKGKPNAETSFVMNAKELSNIIKQHVIEKIDHKNLNMDVDFMKEVLPTTENLTQGIWDQIHPHIKECDLHCVKIQETENIYVEYYGE